MNKVLVLSSAHPWDDERVFNKITLSLKKRYEVILCAVAENDFVFDQIRVYGLKKLSRKKRYKNYPRIIDIIKKENPDVIHFHDPDLIILGIFLKLFLKKKIIYDVHEDYPLAFKNRHYLPKPMINIFSSVFNIFEKTFSKMFDGLTIVTDDIYKKFSHKNKIVIKNYPKIQEYIMNDRNYNIDSTMNIVYIGSVSYERGISNVISALGELKDYDIRLDIYGPFEDESFFNEIKEHECDKIKIWGRVPSVEIPKILCRSHIGIVTLLPYERYKTSLPLKLFEYMAAGIPVIASNFELWRYIIEGADCGVLVDPQDIGQIKDAILYFYHNKYEIEKKGLNGKRAVLDRYNWGVEEEKLFEFYEKIL